MTDKPDVREASMLEKMARAAYDKRLWFNSEMWREEDWPRARDSEMEIQRAALEAAGLAMVDAKLLDLLAEYLCEYDNPVPDAILRKNYRDRLSAMFAAGRVDK